MFEIDVIFAILFKYLFGSDLSGLGLLNILTFCLGIDAVNYMLEKGDNMNILNGIIIFVCILSLERNITCYLRKLKKHRQSQKMTRN
jgi:hypothetical protein